MRILRNPSREGDANESEDDSPYEEPIPLQHSGRNSHYRESNSRIPLRVGNP